MSKITFSIILLTIFSILLPKTSFALTPCPDIGYDFYTTTTDPNIRTDPTANEQFTMNFYSSDIKGNQQYTLRLDKDNLVKENAINVNIMIAPATSGNGYISLTTVKDLPTPEGNYRVHLFKGLTATGSTNEICVSDPFSIKTSSGAPPPEIRCLEFNTEIKDKKIVLSGKGTLTTGSYTSYMNRIDASTPIPLGILNIKEDGSFGPAEYNLPTNYPGGKTTINLMHSKEGQVARCSATLDISNTQSYKTKRCLNLGETFDPNVHKGDRDNPEKCTLGGGKEITGCTKPDPDDPKKTIFTPGIATAIGCIHTNPPELIKDFMTFIVGISGGLAFLMMLGGVFQMMSSGGNPEAINAGKSRLTSAVIGLLIVIFATLLLQIIGVDILQIPGFNR